MGLGSRSQILIEFRNALSLSFRDEQHLSLVATELNDGSARPTGIRERGKEILTVPVVAVYGANASGKTTLRLRHTYWVIRVHAG